jgi:hypothetical protein
MSKEKRVISGVKKIKPGDRCVESLSHFWCKKCKKWWSVGDAPLSKKDWFCAWCGDLNKFK